MPADYTIYLGREGTVGDVTNGTHLPATAGAVTSVDFINQEYATGKAMSVVLYSKEEWGHHSLAGANIADFAPISPWGTEYFRMITTPVRLYYKSTAKVFIKTVFH